MKKIIIIVLTLALLAVAGYSAYQYFLQEEENFEDILPGEALALVRLNNIQENFAKIKNTPFYKTISSIDYEKLMKQTNSNPQEVHFLLNTMKNMESISENETVQKMFNEETALAVYPVSIDMDRFAQAPEAQMINVVSEFSSSFIFLTRVPKDIQALEFLSRFKSSYGDELITSEQTYKGYSYNVAAFRKSGISVGYLRRGDILIFGLGARPVQKIIDVLGNDTPALALDENFQLAKSSFFEDSGADVFVDLKKAFELFKEHFQGVLKLSRSQMLDEPIDDETRQAQIEAMDKRMNDSMRKMKGFQAIGITYEFDDLWHVKTQVFYDKGRMDPRLSKFYLTCDPVDNQTLEFIPRDILGYQWGNCFDLEYYWEEFQEQLAKAGRDDQNVRAQLEKFEESLGISVEDDILAAIGDEAGGFLVDIEVQGFFPIPKLALFLKVKSQDKMNALLGQLLDNKPGIMLQQGSYQSVDYRYIFSPIGEVLQPTYGYLGDYLLITINQSVFHTAVDALKDKSGNLTADADFKNLPGFSKKSNGIVFFKPGTLMSRLKSLTNWGDQWMSSQEQQQQAFYAGSRQRLDKTQVEIAAVKGRIQGLEDQIWKKELDPETEALLREIEGLRQELQEQKDALLALEQEEQELIEITSVHQDAAGSAEERQLYLNELIYPLLEGMSKTKSFGVKSLLSDKFLRIDVLSDMGN